jgi:hypothetical protein
MNDARRRRVLNEAYGHIDRLRDMPEPPTRADDGEPDALQAWAERMPAVEPEPEPVISKRDHGHALPPPIDIHAEIEAAVETAIEAEHEFNTELLAELYADLQRTAADDLERSVRVLTAELAELRAVLNELRATIAVERIERTGGALDLPRLPRGREIN